MANTSANASQSSWRDASAGSTRAMAINPIEVSNIASAGNTSSRRSSSGRATTQMTPTAASAAIIGTAARRAANRSVKRNMQWDESLVKESGDEDNCQNNERHSQGTRRPPP